MKLLEQKFTAVRYNGDAFTISDIETLIKDWGPYRFIQKFGLSHGIKPYGQAVNEHEASGYYNRNFTGFGDSLAYEKEFILENSKGNLVDPNCVVTEYLDRYPKKEFYPWRDRNLSRNCKKYISRDIGYYRGSDHRMLKEKAGVVTEEGEPPMKKLNFAFSAPYDDCYQKRGQRNWKQFRKTRYK